ncbi:MAG: hypothetical protein NTY65_07465 [Planctomycetota bacterium]|nr:hypothetical protein [Planctomycetota bacterium]
MLRYVGYLLMVLAVLAMAGTVVVCLIGGLQEEFRMPGAMRLVAFDEAATTKTPVLRVGAQLQNLDFGKPIALAYMAARYDDGWCESSYTNSLGVIRWVRRGPLPAGLHHYTASFPETHPRVDVRAGATVWVVPAGVPALWVDAAALGPEPQAGGPAATLPSAEAMRPALDMLKTLAGGRQVVYLVAGGADDYAEVRERLREDGATPGPLIWLRQGNEVERLKLLKDGWPDVDGAVVAAPVVADAVAKLKVRVFRLPRAADDVLLEPSKTGAVRSTGEGN